MARALDPPAPAEAPAALAPPPLVLLELAEAPERKAPWLPSGARVLSIGIASTGLFTFAYLAAASHVLSRRDYSLVSLCWAMVFVILSVIYRPIEQLLSRTIADRRARGLTGHPLRVPALIQAGFALGFLAVVLGLHGRIVHGLFGGSAALYWILVIAVLAYAGSYFARGWLAGHQYFALYGALVLLESTSRFLFPLAAAVGIGSRLGVVAAGIAVAPFASLSVMPLAARTLRRRADRAPRPAPAAPTGELSIRRGGGFAAAVVGIMLSEQALMNGGVLVVAVSLGASDLASGRTGFVFDVMLVARAPLQLFQAIQTSILPHLAGLEVRGDAAAFRAAIRRTVLAIAGFGVAVALGLLAIGPPAMRLLLGDKGFHYTRAGLALVGLGMGLHLIAGTLNQAALARGRAARSCVCWLTVAGLFIAFQIAPVVASRVTRVEIGYSGAAALLCTLLTVVYRRSPAAAPASGAASPAPPGR